MEKSSQSFSQCMGNSFRQTVAGIFSDKRMDSTTMLGGHVISTKSRILESEGEYVLVAQDTTYYNYSGHHSMEGLGKIQGNVRGIMQHNLLSMSELGIPLGLIGQQYWSRESSMVYNGKKESEKWEKGLQRVNSELGEIEKKVVLIQDREADIFSFFEAHRAKAVELIVRVHQPRNMEVVSNGAICKLSNIEQELNLKAEKRVSIVREGKEITLVLSLRAGQVNVLGHKGKTQGLSLVIAREVAAFDATGKTVFDPNNAALWYLLTSLPIDNEEDMKRITLFYSFRWRIERLHYTLKSGALNVEKLQFDDINTTVNALSFYSIVAWKLLAIVYLTRKDADQDARICFEEKEITILEKINKKTLKSLKEVTLALAKLAAFAPSKKQPFPGIKVLALAIERLYYIKLGFDASYLKPLQD